MSNDDPIFRSFAMIEERIHERLTVENLADSLHISKYHYQRIFREAVGDSVMRYVTRRRLSMAAKELVERPDCTILDIALRYGYDTHEGFTRSFRAHMGVTPAEYRKYHRSVIFPATQKERCAMLYAKTTDEMLRELNALIIQAKETAEYTRKNETIIAGFGAAYVQYWENIAQKADTMAEELGDTIRWITAIARQPDEISARFLIIKAIEDAAFWSSVIAFETGLTVSRAKTECSAALMPVCEKYNELARNAGIKAEKIVQFFNELSSLIFQDMRKNAEVQIAGINAKGMEVVKNLTADREHPYAYIAEEIKAVTDELSGMPLDLITIQLLEDSLFRLDIVAFAADVDILRMPSHKELFDGISGLREQLCEAAAFFRNLSVDLSQALAEPQPCSETANGKNMDKKYSDIAFQGNILLFYLRGEIQKLDSAHLIDHQRSAFEEICSTLDQALRTAHRAPEEAGTARIRKTLESVHEKMLVQAKELGECANPIQYIAESLKQLTASIETA